MKPNWTKIIMFVIAIALVILAGKHGIDVNKTINDANVIVEQLEDQPAEAPAAP